MPGPSGNLCNFNTGEFMPRARKKPVEIEYVQWTGKNLEDVRRFAEPVQLEIRTDFPSMKETLVIPTLEGDMDAKQGSYIVKGVKGEIYPVRKDIFKATYDFPI
jgi:hypothetical protein